MEAQAARPLEVPKNLYLAAPKSGSNIAQQYVVVMLIYIFSCSLQYKVTGKSQRSIIFNSQVSYQKKNVHVP